MHDFYLIFHLLLDFYTKKAISPRKIAFFNISENADSVVRLIPFGAIVRAPLIS